MEQALSSGLGCVFARLCDGPGTAPPSMNPQFGLLTMHIADAGKFFYQINETHATEIYRELFAISADASDMRKISHLLN
jgi:hypothetical protein